jgi:hypothetical protein
MQHAARQWSGVVDFHVMAEPRQMIGGRQPARAGTDDQHALAGCEPVNRHRPVLRHCEVAQKPLNGVNTDGAVELPAIAAGFAGMIADTPVHCRQWIVADQRFPCGAVLSSLRQCEPRLDVLAGRAGGVAGRKQVDIDRMLMTNRASPSLAGEIDHGRHVAGKAVHFTLPIIRAVSTKESSPALRWIKAVPVFRIK